jgi:hypothetical protein
VLQRIVSARDEKAAASGALLGGIVYFFIALIPVFLVSAAALIDAPMVEKLIARDHQLILPTLILERTPFAIQVLFFGALISAILSTASGALLAPAVMLAETSSAARARNGRRRAPAHHAAHGPLPGRRHHGDGLTSSLSIYQLVNESGKVVLVAASCRCGRPLLAPGDGSRGTGLRRCGWPPGCSWRRSRRRPRCRPPSRGSPPAPPEWSPASAFHPVLSAFVAFSFCPGAGTPNCAMPQR